MDSFFPTTRYQVQPNGALDDISNFSTNMADLSPPRYNNGSPSPFSDSTERLPGLLVHDGRPFYGRPDGLLRRDARAVEQLPSAVERHPAMHGVFNRATPFAPTDFAHPPGLPAPNAVHAHTPAQGAVLLPVPSGNGPHAVGWAANIAQADAPVAAAPDRTPATAPASSTRATAQGRSPATSGGGTGAKKGAGSRSGSNRRDAGGSDDEVNELTAAELAQAGITPRAKKAKKASKPPAASLRIQWSDEHTLIVVDKVTSPDVWPNFKLNQAIIFDELVGKLAALRLYVTRDQVRNLWNRLWRKYKEARRIEEVTGGAGDVEARDPAADNDTDGEATNNAAKKSKKRKRKIAADDDGEDEKYSREELLSFTRTDIYKKIDQVAHDDPDVVRSMAYSSGEPIKERPKPRKRARKSKDKKKKKKHSPCSSCDDDSTSSSDSDSDDDSDVARSVVKMIKERAKRQARLDKENLALAEERDRRDAERLRIEREKHECEQWGEYERCKASNDPVLQRRATLLAKKLLGEA